MKKLILLLIPLLFLSSCTIDWNGEKDAKIVELERQVTELKQKNDDNLFKKNKECYSLKDGIKKEYSDVISSRIFYSQKLNSCLGEILFRGDENEYALIDLLKNEIIMHGSGGLNGYSPKTDNLNDEIEYLKN